MQATLIFNPQAGGANELDPADLLNALGEAGYEPVHYETQQESDLNDVLAKASGLIVAAGGDGTLRAVASRLVDRNLPLALVPMGTANNVGRTLGIDADPLEIVRRLARPRKSAFDIGLISAPWGKRTFLEGMGYGFFADNLALYNPAQGKSIFRGISAFTTALSTYRAYGGRLIVDGVEITNNYLLVEVLNTKAVGPRLRLAPDADPKDGFFEIIAVREDEQENFLRYVTGLLTGDFEDLPSVEGFSGRNLEIEWDGFPLHVDAEVLPNDAEWKIDEETQMLRPHRHEARAWVHVEIHPHALELWLPR